MFAVSSKYSLHQKKLYTFVEPSTKTEEVQMEPTLIKKRVPKKYL